jgi:hypothetical protein
MCKSVCAFVCVCVCARVCVYVCVSIGVVDKKNINAIAVAVIMITR